MNNNITFNPRASGSLSVAASSGHTVTGTEESDIDMTVSSNLGAEYTQPSSYNLPTQNQGNSKSFWNLAVMSGYPSHNTGLGNLLESPQLDSQEIQLPSFMFNSIYTSGNQESFKPSHYPLGAERVPLNSKDYNNISNRRVAGKDASVSPLQPFISHYSNNQIIANAAKKKTGYSGNYNPRGPSYDGRTTSSETKTSSLSDSNTYAKAYNSGPHAIEANSSDSLEMLGIELAYKTQVNKAMYAKLLSLNADNGDSSQADLQTETKDSMRLPPNYHQLFRDLTHTLNERTQELEETKSIMEAILVSLVMTKDSTITTNGTFDAQDLAHKITSKMAVLQSENEALLQMVSHSNKQSLVIELGILKSENHALREKIKEMGLQE